MEIIPVVVDMLGTVENDVADLSTNDVADLSNNDVDTSNVSETINEEDHTKSPSNVGEVVFDSPSRQEEKTDIDDKECGEQHDTLNTSEKLDESEEHKSPVPSPHNDEPLTETIENNVSEDLNSNSQLIADSELNNTPLNLSESSEVITHTPNDLSSHVEDVLCFPSSRCQIYERLNKKIISNFRGLGESSLSICGVNNLFVPYKCKEDCNFASVSLSALKIHMILKHAGDDFYLCTYCGERFVCDDSLLEHVCKHHYDHHKIAFKCNIKECSRSFQRIDNLKHHLLSEHKGSELVPCSFCYRESYSLDGMINHVRSHLKHTVRCAHCYMAFASKEKAVKHIHSAHAGFLRKINLQVEVMNHDRLSKQKDSSKFSLKLNSFNGEDSIVIGPVTKPLPYQCHSCCYTCNDNDILKIHLKEDHMEIADIKDFSCNFCKFSSNDKEAITNHLCFHTNAKFLRCYSCPYCAKQCNSINIIESHLHSHHPKEAFKFEAGQEDVNYLQDIVACPFCIGIFKWKSNLCFHFSNDHNMKRLADYLIYQCKANAPKTNLVLPKELLNEKSDSVYNASIVNEIVKDESAFKCVKCDFKHSNYNAYNEHVKSHYEMFDARENAQVKAIKKENPMLFVCKLCPFQCNKSLNFKRHSAIHERAKNLENCFKCGYCLFRHNRINCIKFHLGKYHANLPIKVIKITNGEELEVTELEIIKGTNTVERERGSPSKRSNNKPPNEYFDSFLPRGMIFAQPIKCPTCDYANRVRINLIRHMRQHMYEDLVHPLEEKVDSFQEDHRSEKNKKFESPPRYETLHQREASEDGDSSFQMYTADGVTTKKLFKCAYCDVVSKWNRRDISLHILHVHLQKKVYTCSYCDYGSRKSSQMVMNHCSRVHPGKPVIIKDELALFNSVVPLRDGDGVITVAYVKENGLPILTLEELGVCLKLNVRKNKNELTLGGNSDKEDGNFPVVYESKLSPDERFNQDIDDEDISKNLDNSEEWKCMFCGLQMFSEVMMKRHVMCHHMKLKPFSCKYCKAQYWQKQSIENHINSNHPEEDVCYDENVKEKASLISKYMQKLTNVHRIRSQQAPSKRISSIYHCRICGYQDQRHDKAKYHMVKKHLKIGLYSCSKCHQYMRSKGCVENHVQEFHPGSNAYVLRSYDIHALFLQKNIKRIGNFHSQLSKNVLQKKRNNYRIKYESVPTDKSMLTCRHCNYIAESEASLGAHSRVHKVFECYYCDFQNNLMSRVQSHCLIRHPTKPIKHRQIAPVDAVAREEVDEENANSDSSATYEADQSPSDNVEFPRSLSPPDSLEDRNMASRNGQEFLFKCKLCNYNSDKATVIRHHIMSHLLYHPYQCPYCNLVCSVKSSPITKHIQLKHPDKEIRFICKRDEQMEKQVKNSFEKISLDTDGNIKIIETALQDSPIIKDEQHFADNQRIYYKCCFCALITPIRTDMKHHLMRELKYKPFSCAYCHYEEPCRSKMGKHFRTKHEGMTISIKHSVNPKKELEVFEYLRKCTVKNSPKKMEKYPEKSGHIPIIRISNLKNVLISSLHYRGKLHKCSHCCFKTSNIKAFIFHKNIHDKFKLKCAYCQYSNKSIFMLRKHTRKCYVKNYRSTAEVKQARSEWLKSHMRSVRLFVRKVNPALKERHSERWTCCYCCQKLKSMSLLREHLHKHHSVGSRSLRTSSAIKSTRRRSKMLQRTLYKNLTFCCNECHLKSSSLEDFSLHLQSHYTKKIAFPTIEVFPDDYEGSRILRCGFCPLQTSEEEEFTDHVASHTVLHPIKCKYCLFATFTSSDMKQHFESCHPNQDVRFDSLSQPYTMIPAQNVLPNFKPIVKLVDLKFCLS